SARSKTFRPSRSLPPPDGRIVPGASPRARDTLSPTRMLPMLDADLKAQLSAYMERLVQPIELVAALDDSDASRELEALLRDIAGTSDKISVRADDDANARKPSFAIVRAGTDVSVRFA